MIRFKNGGLFNLDRRQLNLGKIYIVGDRILSEIFDIFRDLTFLLKTTLEHCDLQEK